MERHNIKHVYLYFANAISGGSSAGFDQGEMITYPVTSLRAIEPANGGVTLNLWFDSADTPMCNCTTTDLIQLTVTALKHKQVTLAITRAINSPGVTGTIVIADEVNSLFLHPNITAIAKIVRSGRKVLYKNKILDATAVEIIDINTKTEKLTSMTLTNVHTGDATVRVYLKDASGGGGPYDYYIVKDVVIPAGTALKLEGDEIDYDGSVFNLYVKLAGTTPVDVVVR